jgi:hypothetical protein
MNPRRFRIALAATSVLAAGTVTVASWTVHAQSTHTAPALDHQHMTKPDDPRELVKMPAMMQEHMLANMRDHLATLNAVIGEVGEGKFDAASKLLEERLGMSSLPLHQAAEMAPFFPQPMQDAGTSMHHAASRLAIALQDASVAQTFDSMREVNAALHEVTLACVACHTNYRLR